MTEAILILVIMLAVQIAASVVFKNAHEKVVPFTILASVIGALIAGFGLPVRELVEGLFGYLDAVLTSLMGAALIAVLYANGTFSYVLGKISAGKNKLVKTYLLLLLVAIPGIVSGMATVAILTTGILVGSYLIAQGTCKKTAVAFVSFGAVVGMLMPPCSLLGMVLAGSSTGSIAPTFAAASLPLAVLALPLFIVFGLLFNGKLTYGATSEKTEGSFACVVPMIVTLVLYLCYDLGKTFLPFLGLPLISLVGLVLACILRPKKANLLNAVGDLYQKIAPVVATVVVLGTFIEISALSGARGAFTAGVYLMNDALLCVLCFAVVVLLGVFAGFAPSLSVAFLSTYVLYGKFSVMLAMTAAVALGMLFSRNNSLFRQTEAALSVEDTEHCFAKDLKANWICALLLLVMIVVFIVARNGISALRV